MSIYKNNKSQLLNGFNNREEDAFSALYQLYYTEFMLYASRLYANTTVDPGDAVQDVFIYILQNPKIEFDSLPKLRAFVFVSIKNRYKNFIDKLRCREEYLSAVDCEENFEIDIFEDELYAILYDTLELLPHECSQVIRLFLKGYSAEEIAMKLNKNIRTVYNQKNSAVKLLKRKFSHDKMLLSLINII